MKKVPGLTVPCRSGRCHVTIESTGAPSGTFNVASAVPSAFKIAAYALIEECVNARGGQGGFVTYLFANVLDWSQDDVMMNGGWFTPPPDSATFFTVTVSDTDKLFNPGDYDPMVAQKLSYEPDTVATRSNALAPSQQYRSEFWMRRASDMRAGGPSSWWKYQTDDPSDEMEYECDRDLGAPPVNDCTHIQLDQLGPPSDSITITPGVVEFLHSSKQRKIEISFSLPIFTTDLLENLSVESKLCHCRS